MKTFEKKITKKYIDLTDKMNQILNNNEYSVENSIDNNDEYTLDVYANKKKVMTVVCQMMGFYNHDCETFYWGDTMIPTNTNINELVKDIRKSKKKLKKSIIEQKYDDIQYLERILYYISNNVFYIDELNIADLVKYCCYKTDSMGVLVQHKITKNKKHAIHYLIREIKQLNS